MKIAWFTPFSNKSAIGKVSNLICEELVKTEKVQIWTADSQDLIDTQLDVKIFNSSLDVGKLTQYDHVIYNIGNFAGNHRDIYDISLRYPGIIILHDQTMHSFWGQYFLMPEFGGDDMKFSEYKALISKYYGEYGAKTVQAAYDSQHYPIYDYLGMDTMRLIEPVLKGAKGVFTHSKFFVNDLSKIYSGPVDYSYLPIDQDSHSDYAETKEFNRYKQIINQARQNGKKIVVSNGIVHPIKRIDKVAEVLLKRPNLRECICYIVVGGYGGTYGDRLEQLSHSELKDSLFMLGYQEDDIMNYILKNADMCINLRYPNSEVCSLSLIEQMSFGKPTMVIDSGIFGEMSDDSVIKIRLDNEFEDIYTNLNELCKSSNQFENIGLNAAEFVEKCCSTKNYCNRLLKFIDGYEVANRVSQYHEIVIERVAERLVNIGGENMLFSNLAEPIIKHISDLYNTGIKDNQSKKKVLGIWVGFLYHIPNLHREGISRFIAYMTESLIRNYDVNVEVWCYSFNFDEVKTIFSILPDHVHSEDTIRFITEENWMDEFGITIEESAHMGVVNAELDNLNHIARLYSKAACFVPIILYLDNVVGVDKPIFVPAHDMAIAEHYLDFIEKDSLFKARFLDINSRVENLARIGEATFFSNCNTVRQEQILKHIMNLSELNTNIVYLPVNIPKNVDRNILAENEVRRRFGIKSRYMFYPTQIRPYKNVITLLKSFNRLKSEIKDIVLVLTGNPEDIPEVKYYIEREKMSDHLILLSDVSEIELYSIYKYADVTPVPSVFEGGFPWQACEALYMEVPLVLSDIPVVNERIEFHGFTKENCGLLLFDPLDVDAMTASLKSALSDRVSAVKRQKRFRDELLSYDWNDASKQYYRMFFEEDKER